ncbi:nicotinamide riboside transporter PnuC [Thalassotalea agarivorans]|uniref:Nicotinamide riboside transporter PnuC n=1 Tax=Thalassotalea agarivorans TaxID=349064 RepID=A0A1I0EPW2_THASX|nr:nicotinamide riboside transporter PnuC [Thalassotalea agarivorans]SET47321.1 nicotinamide mononucleotide transporter [Thalassotalea agarivorans]
MINEIYAYFATLPMWELIAVFTAIIYVVFAARENIWCWPAALVSTAIYTAIFYDVYLWMDGLLQVYYFAMAIYGWWAWSKKGKQQDREVQIHQWSMSTHVKAIAVLTLLSFGLGFFMANYTPADFPYIDSATTVFAVFTTFLVARKVLENWLYWIVINSVSIYIYIEKGLIPTAFLFVVYVIIAIYGYIHWRQRYTQSQAIATTA